MLFLASTNNHKSYCGPRLFSYVSPQLEGDIECDTDQTAIIHNTVIHDNKSSLFSFLVTMHNELCPTCLFFASQHYHPINNNS
jgi:hypothetical protein